MKNYNLAPSLLALPLLIASSCAPLTFSSEPAIDFSRYRSVRVAVSDSSVHAGFAETYLADQLRRTSGFSSVTVDPLVATDLLLEVELVVNEEIDIDSEGDIDIRYEGEARYYALTAGGAIVDSGEEEDTSEWELEAVEDLLDEIEYHYLDPYRY